MCRLGWILGGQQSITFENDIIVVSSMFFSLHAAQGVTGELHRGYISCCYTPCSSFHLPHGHTVNKFASACTEPASEVCRICLFIQCPGFATSSLDVTLFDGTLSS